MNVFTFTGNCGADMETRFTQGGKAIGTVNVAVRAGYGDHEKTTWVRCQLFGDRAEKLAQYITKGSKITVTGEFYLDEWQGNEGTRYTATVNIREIELPPRQSSNPQPDSGYQQSTGDSVPF